MKKNHGRSILRAVAALSVPVLLALCFTPASYSQTIIDEWDAVKAPPRPELKPIAVDPKTTALLLLDFNKQTCNAERRPRCITSIPKVKRLLAQARARGSFVVFSLSPGATPADIAKELSPDKAEPIVTSGPDKFLGTDLEKVLKENKIATVIVAGTAAHGAVLYTASGAALRGMRVIVPVDGISAETLYPEQYTLWHLTNAPRVSGQVTLTETGLITY
jgi:nicotinamidase-related amidase